MDVDNVRSAPASCESPLPEERQAAAVAALAADAAAGQAALAAATDALAAAVKLEALTASAAAPDAEPAAGEPAAVAEPAPAVAAGAPLAAAAGGGPPGGRVPARLLYGLVDEEPPAAAQQAQQQQGQQQRGPRAPPLPSLPRGEDDGRLPAYAVGAPGEGEQGGGGGGGLGGGGGRGRKVADHADEDPPPGFKPTTLFIGEFGSGRPAAGKRSDAALRVSTTAHPQRDPMSLVARNRRLLPCSTTQPRLHSQPATTLRSASTQVACPPAPTTCACGRRWCQRARWWGCGSSGASATEATAAATVRARCRGRPGEGRRACCYFNLPCRLLPACSATHPPRTASPPPLLPSCPQALCAWPRWRGPRRRVRRSRR